MDHDGVYDRPEQLLSSLAIRPVTSTMAFRSGHRLPDPLEVPVLRVEEVAALLRCGRSTTYEAIERGELPSMRIGRRILIPTAALRQWLGIDPEEVCS